MLEGISRSELTRLELGIIYRDMMECLAERSDPSGHATAWLVAVGFPGESESVTRSAAPMLAAWTLGRA